MPALPTPAQVKALPLFNVQLKMLFASVDDAVIQEDFIDNAAALLGSAENKRHTQWTEAVLYLAGHLLYLRAVDEGAVPGGGGPGGVGVLSGVTLKGVGSKNYAVEALSPEQENDWLVRKSPFSTKLHAVLDTFPPGISTTAGNSQQGYKVGCPSVFGVYCAS